MTALTWDDTSKRQYEMGTDHGVLYPMTDGGVYENGVVWNGLTSVSESPEGAEANDMYADNIKYSSLRSTETFGATIEAYTYPDEFIPCDGGYVDENAPGVNFSQQNRAKFGFSYRTQIGNDVSSEAGYKLHLVYGVTASPSQKSYETINDSPEAITLSWEIGADPVAVGGHPELDPVASITIDSTKVDSAKLAALEKKLYGDESNEPTLPLPGEIYTMMTVIDPTVHVTGVTVEPDSISLTEGDSQQITVTVDPPNATDKTYTISSSDPGKVTVHGTTIAGVVPTTSPVTVTVRTNDGGFTDTVSVTVTARPPIGDDTTNIVGKAIVGKAVL